MGLGVERFKAVLGEPAKTYLWDIKIIGMENASMQVQTTSLPGFDTSVSELYYKGEKAIFAGVTEYSNEWTCEIAEGENANIMNPIFYWRQLIYNQESGRGAVAGSYKMPVVISLLRSRDKKPWLVYTLFGAFPKSVDDLSLDRADTTGLVKWEVTFSYDWWERTDLNVL